MKLEVKLMIFEKIHDNKVLNYLVDLERGEILFHTKTEDGQRVTIDFTEVTAYHFENTVSGCILFGLEQLSADEMIVELGPAFMAERKKFGWPFGYNTIPELKIKIGDAGLSIYRLDSSYGMSGYVLAKDVTVRDNEV